ncbi:MAG TPA: tetratricopeptide repeat protein, partial [bacterium]|nr:tetratricopeptide repeat protein [bacterium]
MKIQCEQCKVEYTIDDASIGERGIRAQCPRCNHITTIRKSQQAILDQARAKLDTAICVNCGKPCEPNPNDPIPICPACQALGSEVGAKTTVSGQQLPPASPSNPLAGLPGFSTPAPLPGFGGASAIGGTPAPEIGSPARDSGSIPAPPVYTPSEQPDEGRSWRIKKSPSGEIYGPFDRDLILGWIETDKIVPADEIARVGGPWKAAAEHEDFQTQFSARYKQLPSRPAAPPVARAPNGGGDGGAEPTMGEGTPGPTFGDAPETQVATSGGAEVPGLAGTAPVGAGPALNPKAGDVRTFKGGAMAIAAGRLGTNPQAGPAMPMRIVGVVAGGLGVVVALAAGVYFSGLLSRGGGSAGGKATPTPVVVDEDTDREIANFAHEFAGATGTAADHVKAGRDAMATDTVVGWQTARKEFGQALALDKRNNDALVGVAEADALLGQYDEQTGNLKEAVELSNRAVDRAPGSVDANRAKAAALIASRSPVNVADARTLLTTKVLVKGNDDAVSTAMLGAALRGVDDADAEKKLLDAIRMNGSLLRPRLELGLLYESQNRYLKALETYKPISARSSLAAFHAGLIQEKVGKYKEAAAAYDAAAKVALGDGGGHAWVEAVLASAVVQYQALDHAKEANAQLLPVAAKVDSGELKIKPELESRLRLHLAIVNRLLGTSESLEKSLRYSAQVTSSELSPAAHFNAGLAKLRKSDFDGAGRELEEADAAGLSGHLKSEVYFWQGQLKQRMGEAGAAGGKYEDAFKADPNNWHAVVAQAQMMAESPDQEVPALDKMQDLAHVDPDFYDAYQRVTPFFADPVTDVLNKAAKSFERIYANRSVDPRASTAQGMVAYLQKNQARAARFFQAALQESDPDDGALVYSALLLEQKGGAENLKAAMERYQQVRAHAPSAFISLVIGRCSLRMGRIDDAIASLNESLQQAPDSTPGHYW